MKSKLNRVETCVGSANSFKLASHRAPGTDSGLEILVRKPNQNFQQDPTAWYPSGSLRSRGTAWGVRLGQFVGGSVKVGANLSDHILLLSFSHDRETFHSRHSQHGKPNVPFWATWDCHLSQHHGQDGHQHLEPATTTCCAPSRVQIGGGTCRLLFAVPSPAWLLRCRSRVAGCSPCEVEAGIENTKLRVAVDSDDVTGSHIRRPRGTAAASV